MVPTVGRIGSGSDSEVSEEDRVTALGLLLAAAICPVSHMHYTPDPAASGGLREIPWIETSNGVFRAHLFYYGSTPWAKSKPLGARIFTTHVKRPVNPKVLWIPRHPSGARTMLIRGRRLDASGSFTRREHVVSGGAFPSYVLVPQAGCWRVTVISGKLSGSVVFAAVDRFYPAATYPSISPARVLRNGPDGPTASSYRSSSGPVREDRGAATPIVSA